MRKVDIWIVSNHSLYQKSRFYCTAKVTLYRSVSDRPSDAVDDVGAVAAGQHAFQIGPVDLRAGEPWPRRNVLQRRSKSLDLSHRADRPAIPDSAGFGNTHEIGGPA